MTFLLNKKFEAKGKNVNRRAFALQDPKGRHFLPACAIDSLSGRVYTVVSKTCLHMMRRDDYVRNKTTSGIGPRRSTIEDAVKKIATMEVPASVFVPAFGVHIPMGTYVSFVDTNRSQGIAQLVETDDDNSSSSVKARILCLASLDENFPRPTPSRLVLAGDSDEYCRGIQEIYLTQEYVYIDNNQIADVVFIFQPKDLKNDLTLRVGGMSNAYLLRFEKKREFQCLSCGDIRSCSNLISSTWIILTGCFPSCSVFSKRLQN